MQVPLSHSELEGFQFRATDKTKECKPLLPQGQRYCKFCEQPFAYCWYVRKNKAGLARRFKQRFCKRQCNLLGWKLFGRTRKRGRRRGKTLITKVRLLALKRFISMKTSRVEICQRLQISVAVFNRLYRQLHKRKRDYKHTRPYR